MAVVMRSWSRGDATNTSSSRPAPSICLGKHGEGDPLEEAEGNHPIYISVHFFKGLEHGLQTDETVDKVIKVHVQVFLCVA